MTTDRFKTLMTGGRIAALAMLMGSAALAQTGDTAIVPAPALKADTPLGFVTESDIPMIEQLDNDQVVAETLIAQGFTNVHILREGALMTVTATRDGVPIELVYSVANGRLVSIDGQETRAAAEAAGEPEAGAAAPDEVAPPTEDPADDGATDDGTGDDGMTDDGTADDGQTDDGSTDGASDDATDGTTDGGDSDAGEGADTGGDSDSDTGSDSGSDSGSEGGESDSSTGG